MRPYLSEVRGAFDCGLYNVALSSALLIPDACGAVEHPTRRNGERYAQWYNQYVENIPIGDARFLDGELVWKIRNGMIHETALDFAAYGFDRVVFTVPNRMGLMMDGASMLKIGPLEENAIGLDLERFIDRVILGADRWIEAIADDVEKRERLNALIQLRPDGLNPFLLGVVILA